MRKPDLGKICKVTLAGILVFGTVVLVDRPTLVSAQ